ncbi:unnamed protein product [Tilletia controversa]|nr:unnamed protein product [Tilletia controversa]CAD6948286.1 unnamed protein product [Tilletia controversa]CAD6969631.1 unnamed protein product [Tilletia controversa]CAD6982546.1 unnamed protein product [Tilletia controversa]
MNLQSQRPKNDRTYEFVVVSQPKTGCAFGDQPLSRIPISPPLVARLRIFDHEGVEVTAGDDMPFFTCQVSLLTEDGRSADLVVPRSIPTPIEDEAPAETPSSKRRATGRMSSGRGSSGTSGQTPNASGSQRTVSQSASTSASIESSAGQGLMSSFTLPTRMLAGDRPAHADIYFDENKQRRLLFIFPEISVRLVGKFRFQLNLTRLPSSNAPVPSFAFASTVTDVVTVVERNDFVASAPDGIVSALAAQGFDFPMLNSKTLIES